MMNTKFFLAFSSIVCKRSQALLVLMTEESGWLIPDSQGPTITQATAVGVKYKSSESSHPQRQAVRDPQRQVSDQPSTKASCQKSTKTSQILAIHKDKSVISHPQRQVLRDQIKSISLIHSSNFEVTINIANSAKFKQSITTKCEQLHFTQLQLMESTSLDPSQTVMRNSSPQCSKTNHFLTRHK